MKQNKIIGGALIAFPISAVLVAASYERDWKFMLFVACLITVALAIVSIGIKIYYWGE